MPGSIWALSVAHVITRAGVGHGSDAVSSVSTQASGMVACRWIARAPDVAITTDEGAAGNSTARLARRSPRVHDDP